MSTCWCASIEKQLGRAHPEQKQMQKQSTPAPLPSEALLWDIRLNGYLWKLRTSHQTSPLISGTDWEVEMKQQPRCSWFRCDDTRASLLSPTSHQLSAASPAGQSMSMGSHTVVHGQHQLSLTAHREPGGPGIPDSPVPICAPRPGFHKRAAVTFLWSCNLSCQTFTSPSSLIIKPLIP